MPVYWKNREIMAGDNLPGKEYNYAENEDEQGRRQTV